MPRLIITALLLLAVCLCPGCGGTSRAVVVDTRPTAAQAQAQADAGKSISDLRDRVTSADQAAADAIARDRQARSDLASARLSRDELIFTLIAVLAVFVAGAAEALALYEKALAWLLKPLGYALAGVAVTAYCVRLALPWLGFAEAALLLAIMGVGFWSLRNTALAKKLEAEGEVLIGDIEAEGRALLTKAHILKPVAIPVPPPVGTVIPPA